jgi:hypothetical protein
MMNATIVADAIVALAAIVASFLVGARYVAAATGSSLYVVDRFTGIARECSLGECTAMAEGLEALPQRRK